MITLAHTRRASVPAYYLGRQLVSEGTG